MVSSVAQEKIDVVAQQLRLSPTQTLAAWQALEDGHQGAYLKYRAIPETRGLATLQWFKLQEIFSHSERITHHDWEKYDEYEMHQSTSLAFTPEEMAQVLKNGADDDSKNMQKFIFYCVQHFNILPKIRQMFCDKAQVHLVVAGKLTEPVKALQAQWPDPLPLFKKMNPLMMLKFWELRKTGIKLEFTFDDAKAYVIRELAACLTWDSPADAWIQKALENAYQNYFWPRIQRELLAMAYDSMVEQMLPVVENRWRQVLLQKAMGEQSMLLLYPHGKSGVMVLSVDAAGQLMDDAMIYPYAPDYDAEQTLSYLAKCLIRKNITQVALMVQPETKKILLKTLNALKKRYADLQWELHLYSPALSYLIPSHHSKQPQVDDVLTIARCIQSPWDFWMKADPLMFLSPLLRCLPKASLQGLWQHMLNEKAYLWGAVLPSVNKELYEELQQAPDWQQAHAWEMRKPQVMTPELKNRLSDIPVGERFQAVVSRLMSYGVFVDLGEGVEGLIHISAMGDCFISDVTLLMQAGDVIEVEWIAYDADQHRLSLKLHQAWKPKMERLEKAKPTFQEKPKKEVKKIVHREKTLLSNKAPTAMELAFAKLKG